MLEQFVKDYKLDLNPELLRDGADIDCSPE